MRTLIACSTFAASVSLAVGRPQVGPRWQIGPASAAVAGVFCLLFSGIVRPADFAAAAAILWRPFITILSIMLTTAAARRAGVIDALAHIAFAGRRLSARRLFPVVFVLSAATATLLNNDAAVLLLTPLVLIFVRSRYPGQPRLLPPFAFAVFMAAGVAPFVVSNPMNMIVASYAGLDFNAYTASMLPISLVGSLVTFLILRGWFALDLSAEPATTASWPRWPSAVRLGPTQGRMLILLLAVLGSYPIVASIDGSAIWLVSAAGAALALLLVRQPAFAALRRGSPQREARRRQPAFVRLKADPTLEMVATGINWEILIFLPAVFVLAIGLRNVGVVDALAAIYAHAGIGLIGATAAIGSATLNNHPMAMMNMLALGDTPSAGHREVLAMLVGGDLGPRLLPIGSLAGLLWLESCRVLGVTISLGQFVKVGLALTVPTLAVSLSMLYLF